MQHSVSVPQLSAHRSVAAVVFGLVLGMFLAALESTVIATAMPTVIRELGGQALYALPFAVYMLTSTVSSPLWGRASDRMGRRRLYLAGEVLFLVGSALCGAAQSMAWLTAARALQGLGGGALMTLTFTIVGEQFPLAERARVQGLISGVWGLAGVVGPLAGGLIVDHLSWRWVFYVNLPFGLVSVALVAIYYRDHAASGAPPIDWRGALGFTAGSAGLVWGLEDRSPLWIAVGGVVLAAAMLLEWRSPAPLLPQRSLRDATARTSIIANLLAGAAYFGSIAYLPLFAQGVGGRSASAAGVLLTPMVLGWTSASIVASRVLPRLGMHRLTLWGFATLAAGFLGFWLLALAPLPFLGASGFVAGAGMGFAMLALLVGTQENVPRAELGSVTAAVLFARAMGGVIGVALMHQLIGPVMAESRLQLAVGLRRAFLLGLALIVCAWVMVARSRHKRKTSPAVAGQ